MNIGVLGTGTVGVTIATKLIQNGHHVMMGSRSANNEKATAWAASHGSKAANGTFAEAAAFGEIVFLCLNGSAALSALHMADRLNFNGKTVVDITNPLDFSKGMPPTLFVSNTDSLGEQVQETLSGAKVVKALNTVTAEVMVNPALVPGEIDMLICGNDDEAKAAVEKLLKDFGWKSIIDLGTIQSSRYLESYVLLWVNLWQKFGSPYFGVKFIKR